MRGLYERCSKDARLVSLHTIQGMTTSEKEMNHFFTRYPGMSWMRDSYPLQRCFHETHNTYHKIDFITFVSRVYRAQYAFATLNKVLFCCTRKVSRYKAV